ncbi:hypothetical protein Tco_1181583, partial [Tanacetum coccineum]
MNTPPTVTSVRNLTGEAEGRDKQAVDAWNAIAMKHAEETSGPHELESRHIFSDYYPVDNGQSLRTSSPDDDQGRLTINTKHFVATTANVSAIYQANDHGFGGLGGFSAL